MVDSDWQTENLQAKAAGQWLDQSNWPTAVVVGQFELWNSGKSIGWHPNLDAVSLSRRR